MIRNFMIFLCALFLAPTHITAGKPGVHAGTPGESEWIILSHDLFKEDTKDALSDNPDVFIKWINAVAEASKKMPRTIAGRHQEIKEWTTKTWDSLLANLKADLDAAGYNAQLDKIKKDAGNALTHLGLQIPVDLTVVPPRGGGELGDVPVPPRGGGELGGLPKPSVVAGGLEVVSDEDIFAEVHSLLDEIIKLTAPEVVYISKGLPNIPRDGFAKVGNFIVQDFAKVKDLNLGSILDFMAKANTVAKLCVEYLEQQKVDINAGVMIKTKQIQNIFTIVSALTNYVQQYNAAIGSSQSDAEKLKELTKILKNMTKTTPVGVFVASGSESLRDLIGELEKANGLLKNIYPPEFNTNNEKIKKLIVDKAEEIKNRIRSAHKAFESAAQFELEEGDLENLFGGENEEAVKDLPTYRT